MTRMFVSVGFLVAFAAGWMVGMNAPSKEPPPPPPGHREGWLAAELGLSDEQRQQLDAIWSETARQGGHDRDERRRQLFRQRDEDIAALIRPEDRAKYDALREDFSRQMEALDQEWRSSFEAAVEKTRHILTPEQRDKYEALMKRHDDDRGKRDWRRPPHDKGPPGESRPASQPSSQP